MTLASSKSPTFLKPDFSQPLQKATITGYHLAKLMANQSIINTKEPEEFFEASRCIFDLLVAGVLSYKGKLTLVNRAKPSATRLVHFGDTSRECHFPPPFDKKEKVEILKKVTIQVQEIYDIYRKGLILLPEGFVEALEHRYSGRQIAEDQAKPIDELANDNLACEEKPLKESKAQRNLEAKKAFASLHYLLKLEHPGKSREELLRIMKKHPLYKYVKGKNGQAFKHETLLKVWMSKAEKGILF